MRGYDLNLFVHTYLLFRIVLGPILTIIWLKYPQSSNFSIYIHVLSLFNLSWENISIVRKWCPINVSHVSSFQNSEKICRHTYRSISVHPYKYNEYLLSNIDFRNCNLSPPPPTTDHSVKSNWRIDRHDCCGDFLCGELKKYKMYKLKEICDKIDLKYQH